MIKLYAHQETALAYLRINDSFALFMEQGTGKTIVALTRLLELIKSDQIANALIVAPKSALGAWERDIELFDPGDRAMLTNRLTLINYDRVWRGDKFTRDWDAIILDEAHSIKNRASKRSKYLLKLSSRAKYKYILTGTPISNGQLENIWSEYCFLDCYLERGYPRSRIFGGSYSDFEKRYCILNMYHKPTSYVRVNELQEIINDYSYRVKKVDCLDLPDKLPDEIVKVDLLEKGYYKKLATESAILDLELLADNPLTRLLHLRQIASGFLTTESGEVIELKTDKISALTEILEGFEDDKKIVIFADFKHSIRAISELLDKLKYTYVVLDGDQKDKTIWRRFQAEPKIKIIVCQYQTANAGIDLFSSDTIIYYEPTLRSTILEQSRDRIHRSGQVNKCSYIHLLTKGTIEIDIYRALSGYSDFNEALFTRYMSNYQRSYK